MSQQATDVQNLVCGAVKAARIGWDGRMPSNEALAPTVAALIKAAALNTPIQLGLMEIGE